MHAPLSKLVGRFIVKLIRAYSINIQFSSSIGYKFPNLFSRSWSDSDDVGKILNFFAKERGSIALSEAVCLTHKIDIADR